MNDIAFGVLAIAVGLLFCFFGATMLRLTITILGAFAGFSLGVGVIAGWFC